MSTSLDDLPVSGGSNSNVNLQITEQNQMVDNPVSKLQEQRNNDLNSVQPQQPHQSQHYLQQQQYSRTASIASEHNKNIQNISFEA